MARELESVLIPAGADGFFVHHDRGEAAGGDAHAARFLREAQRAEAPERRTSYGASRGSAGQAPQPLARLNRAVVLR
jgi:hypothetical protein